MHLKYVLTSSVVALAALTLQLQNKKGLLLDFKVLRGDSASDASQNKRAKIVKRANEGYESLELANQRSYYQVDLAIGSNGDKCQVLIDTGSSDLWVMGSDIQCSALTLSSRDKGSRRRALSAGDIPKDLPKENGKQKKAAGFENGKQKKAAFETITLSSFPTEYASLLGGGIPSYYYSQVDGGEATAAQAYSAPASVCTALGSFNTAGSDSFNLNSSAPEFTISYADGTYARGVWGQDSINFRDFNVSDVSLAVVNSTDSNFGVLGIGLEGLETTYSGSVALPYTYENLPVRLKRTGAIDKVLYSLYLAESSSDTGTILFGAVDHAKYSGQLQTVPVVNIYGDSVRSPIRLDVALDSLSLQSNSQNLTISSSRIAALLDSGTTLSYLPLAMLSSLYDAFQAEYSSTVDMYRIDCAYNTDSAFVVFNFSGIEIKVPISDMVLTYGNQCFLGVLEQTSDSSTQYPYAILGDNFLRNAYIVYDLEDLEISMAQAKYTSDTDIEAVSSSVPLAVKAADYSSTALATSVSLSTSLGELSLSGIKKNGGERTTISGAIVALVGLGAALALF